MMEDKIVVYSSYYNPIEANIVKSRLEDSGFSCFLTDENVATINPLYNQAIGGVKLNVFEKDVAQINKLLNEAPGEVDDVTVVEEPSAQVVCVNCGSTNVSLGQATQNRFSWWVTLISILLVVYPFKTNTCYHCYSCGHEFK